MTQPTKDQITAAIQALVDDAGIWRNVAGELGSGKGVAQGLTLTGWDFSWIAEQFGITELYGQVQQKMVKLLGEGEANGFEVAEALLKSAQTYEYEEARGVHRMRNVY